MNIWILNHYAVPQKYYHLARSYNFCQKLLERGHSVTIFAASSVHDSDINLIDGRELYREMEEDGINYVLFKARQYSGSGKDRVINHLDCAFKMKKHCAAFVSRYGKPDVIYATAGQTMTLWAGIKLAKELGVPCVSEVTDLWPESFVAYGYISRSNPAYKMMLKGERWIYKNSDALIFSMEGGRDYILEHGWDKAHGGPINMEKVYYINNGVDLKKFDFNRENNKLSDNELEDSKVFKVVYTGSLRQANNISALLGAAKLLKQQGRTDIRVLIFGDGDQRESLMNDAPDNVVFKGKVSGDLVPYILSRCDACFIDGMAEGEDNEIAKYGMSQNKLFTYLASGKPIINPIESNYDLLKSNNTGFCIPNTPEAVCSTIIKLADSPELCRKHSAESRRLAEQFDFNVLTDQLLEIFNSAIYENKVK